MPRLMKKPIQVPFTPNGMLEGDRPWMNNVTYKDNYVFSDTLKFEKFTFARAGTKFVFRSTTDNKRYFMFQTEMEAAIPLMEKGILKGTFTFVKRSTAFGIKMV